MDWPAWLADAVPGAHQVSKLEQLGLRGASILGETAERPNVLYRLKGTKGSKVLLYVAHTDTKPIGEARSLWEPILSCRR